MKIIVCANIVPFTKGGSEYHIQGLVTQLKKQGHQVECIRLPFQFKPDTAVEQLMAHCQTLDFNISNGKQVDKLISLQFPTYAAQHQNHSVWIMHQHRSEYELFKPEQASETQYVFRKKVIDFDNEVLGRISKRFTNSARVAQRLFEYNQLEATPLYHPPYSEQKFYTAESQGYIFCPSRLDLLKRQNLLIEAAQYLRTSTKILIAGEGQQKKYYQEIIDKNNLNQRVILLGHVNEEEKRAFYANALGIFFAPYDEDYGYITLESQLSAKPVISCIDSGGPLEFIEDEQNGYILPADAKQIAATIDKMYDNPNKTKEMGQYALESYKKKEISWENVISKLLA